MKTNFSEATVSKLGYYVYCLGHPTEPFKTFKPFYIGKGKDNRVFEHILGVLQGDENGDKNRQIRELLDRNVRIEHYIIRHGMTENEAFAVEASLIDFLGLENLTNEVAGHGSSEFGMMTAEEIEQRYAAQPVDIDDPALILNVRQQFRYEMTSEQLYEVARKEWKVDKARCKKVVLALAYYKGICRGVFEVDGWQTSKDEENLSDFTGRRADSRIEEKYLGKLLEKYMSKSQNAIKYVNC